MNRYLFHSTNCDYFAPWNKYFQSNDNCSMVSFALKQNNATTDNLSKIRQFVQLKFVLSQQDEFPYVL